MPKLKIEYPSHEKKCVRPKEFMRKMHPHLLHWWRDLAIREGQRRDGEYHISFRRSCLQCHSQEKFCNACHGYMGVKKPYCWDCHGQ